MSIAYYHQLCCRYKDRAVEIRTCDGSIHRGVIQDVDKRQVFISELGSGNRGLGGFGYGFFGPGPGYGRYNYRRGYGIGIALGAITSLALLPFFF